MHMYVVVMCMCAVHVHVRGARRACVPLTWDVHGARVHVHTWQVRGLDLRKLDKGQFTPFGRLIDKSFQMPREFQGMTAD